ncbi:hypothetical protein, partial [Klebsiella pneumoniae]|uniref:hypothetical protein n=1 Tax=Klebsiella pneumoniae TaxID=573 RepID=UPI001D185F0D
KRAYCLKIQPATGSFARNLIYSTKPLLIRLQTSVFSSHRGAYRRIARDQVSPFFDDWSAVEEKLKVMLSGNELTPEQEELKSALGNDD